MHQYNLVWAFGLLQKVVRRLFAFLLWHAFALLCFQTQTAIVDVIIVDDEIVTFVVDVCMVRF